MHHHDLWTKLVTNVALNANSAVVNAPYSEIAAIPETRETVRQPELGVSTPVNRSLLALVKLREARMRLAVGASTHR